VMAIDRRGKAEQFLKQAVNGRRFKKVHAAHDMGDGRG
jgi:hypothetical protein